MLLHTPCLAVAPSFNCPFFLGKVAYFMARIWVIDIGLTMFFVFCKLTNERYSTNVRQKRKIQCLHWMHECTMQHLSSWAVSLNSWSLNSESQRSICQLSHLIAGRCALTARTTFASQMLLDWLMRPTTTVTTPAIERAEGVRR